jgi:hypothetical protein
VIVAVGRDCASRLEAMTNDRTRRNQRCFINDLR